MGGASAEAVQSDAVLSAIADAAQRILSETDWRPPITALLARLGEITLSSGAYVHRTETDAEGVHRQVDLFQWTSPEAPDDLTIRRKAKHASRDAAFQDWSARNAKGEIVQAIVAELSEDKRSWLDFRGLKAVLQVPVLVRGTWWGVVGFEDAWRPRRWTDTEIASLSTAAGLIGVAIERMEGEAALVREHEHFRVAHREAERIAAQRTAELARKSENLEAVLANMVQGVILVDGDGVILAHNERFREMLDLPASVLAAGARLEDVIRYQESQGEFGPGGRGLPPRLTRDGRAVLDQTPLDRLIYERQRPNGRWIEIHSNPKPGGGYVRTYADITERKRAETELRQAERRIRESEALLRETLDSLDASLVVYDADDRYVLGNRRYHERYPHLPAEAELVGRSFEVMIRASLAAGEIDDPAVSSDPEAWIARRLDRRRRSRDGTDVRRDRSGAWTLVKNTLTESGKTVTLRIDITDQKQMEEELKVAKEAAEAATVAKSAFLATMSHEIRTPLNGVIANLELLTLNDLGAEQRQLVASAEQAAKALLTVINEILDFSKIEAGKIAIEMGEARPAALVDEVAAMLGSSASAKGVALRVEVAPGVPEGVRSDGFRLRQILINLVGNAIKFTDAGGVLVRVAFAGGVSGRPGLLRFQVHDTGIGFDPKLTGDLFGAFNQADSATTRRFGGTGLGLAISKSLVDLLGGTIGCDGVKGEGASFWFEVPAEVLSPAPPPEDALSGRAVRMEVEDAELAQAIAAAGARLASSGEPADVVLLAGPAAAPPEGAAILLAPESAANRRLALRSGFAGMIAARAPVAHAVAEIALAAAGGRASSAMSRPEIAAETLPRFEGKGRILVVEDSPMNQTVARRQLERLGLACDIAGDGAKALERLEAGTYALVLADCAMPTMDGYEMTRRWRAREAPGQRLPIIAMTANTLESDIRLCREAGMDDYLAKPVALERLARALARWLGGGAAAEAAAEAPGIGRSPIDLVMLGETIGISNPVDQRDLLAYFVETQAPIERALADAVAGRDLAALRRAAHSAKGTARNAAALDLGDLLARMEAAAASADWPAITALWAEVERAHADVRRFVGRLVEGRDGSA